VLGSLPLLGISLLTDQHQWDHLSAWHWLGLLYASVLGSAAAYGLFFYFAAQENLTAFSSLTFLTPVFALILGSLWLGESLTPWQWTGVAVTLLSVYGVNQRQEATKWLRWARFKVGQRLRLAKVGLGGLESPDSVQRGA